MLSRVMSRYRVVARFMVFLSYVCAVQQVPDWSSTYSKVRQMVCSHESPQHDSILPALAITEALHWTAAAAAALNSM